MWWFDLAVMLMATSTKSQYANGSWLYGVDVSCGRLTALELGPEKPREIVSRMV